MKITISCVLAALLASLSNSVEAAFSCDIPDALSGAQLAQASSFCMTYLGLTPVTSTTTLISTKATRWVTQGALTTTTKQILPAASTSTSTLRQTTLTTTTPASRAVTQYITSTAYLDNDGNTVTIMKRAEPTQAPHLEARARPLVTPSFFSGMKSSELRYNCRCLSLARPTIVRSVTKAVFATSTKVLARKLIKTTTLPVPIVPTVQTNVLIKVITAAAPPAVTSVTVFEDVYACPPNQPQTSYLCPAGTASDDESDPNYNTCGVEALDGFSGNCLYWQDDGSAVESILRKGDGSGDSDNDELRYATYGDGDDDDCPLAAEYSCAPAPMKRSLFNLHHRRSYYGAKVADHGKGVTSANRTFGKYIPYEVYQAKVASAHAARVAATSN